MIASRYHQLGTIFALKKPELCFFNAKVGMATSDLVNTDIASTLASQLSTQAKGGKVSGGDPLAFLLAVGGNSSSATKLPQKESLAVPVRKAGIQAPQKAHKNTRVQERSTVDAPPAKKQRIESAPSSKDSVRNTDRELDEVISADVAPAVYAPVEIAPAVVSMDALRTGFANFALGENETGVVPEEILLGDAENDVLMSDSKALRDEKGSSQSLRQALADVANTPVAVDVSKQEMMPQQRTQILPLDSLAETIVKAETVSVQNGGIDSQSEKLIVDGVKQQENIQPSTGDAVKAVFGGADKSLSQGGEQSLGQQLQQGAQPQLIPAAASQNVQAQTAAEFKGEIQNINQPQAVGGATSVSSQQSLARTLAATPQVAPMARGALAPQINQIAIQIKQGVDTNMDSVRVSLRPAEMGTVDVRLDLSGRQVVAQVTADNESTLHLLKDNADQLAQALKSLGLDLSEGAMNFNLKGQEQHQQEQSTNHTGSKKNLESVAAAEEQFNDPDEGRYHHPHWGNVTIRV